MARTFKIGDRIHILPGYTYEWDADLHTEYIIRSIDQAINGGVIYVTELKHEYKAFRIERVIHGPLTKLMRIIYD